VEQTRSDELIAQVRRYLAGELSRDELQDWLVPLVWDPDSAGLEPQTDNLVNSIQLHLAELTGGHITEEEFRGYLRALLPSTVSVFVSYGAQERHYGSSPQDTSVAAATVGGQYRVDFTPQPSFAGR
jgi:hypothetical protein